ncbi:MAG TPA: carbon-nitrogen hydrolase family protein [Anaerolineales bacterium]|nr:carbon-nitrogen hydrolase family protein [Anaerolineales bacterium]
MSTPTRIAVVQMNASPGSIKERLKRAENFVVQCVENGAQLIVLPEVFNTGYEYSDQNYLRAESFDGLTATWMRKTATRYHVHLAGSFLRREQNAIFNTLLLVAPENRQWHYNKNYPWVWERAYFQKGANITVADTELGKIGFLICWDVAHPNLWEQYAGKIELMIVSSCPPKALDLALVLPDGQRIMSRNTGALTQYLKRTSDKTFGEYLRKQASFLGVPVAHSTSTGAFNSSIPNPKSSLAMLSIMYPPLLKYKSRFDQVRLETDYFNETYITDNSGTILQSVPPNIEGFAISDVILPDSPPHPKGKQPPFGISRFAYLFDTIANRWLASEYRQKTQRYLSKQALLSKDGV